MSTIAETYIDDVLSGRIVAGNYIKKAFERHRKDLKTGKERGLHFEPDAGQYVIDFCETFCVPSAMSEPIKPTKKTTIAP